VEAAAVAQRTKISTLLATQAFTGRWRKPAWLDPNQRRAFSSMVLVSPFIREIEYICTDEKHPTRVRPPDGPEMPEFDSEDVRLTAKRTAANKISFLRPKPYLSEPSNRQLSVVARFLCLPCLPWLVLKSLVSPSWLLQLSITSTHRRTTRRLTK
jgi:hypothetical protein